LRAKIHVMVSQLVALAVPPCCAACRAPSRHAAAVLCKDCRDMLPWLSSARCCPRCALPLPHTRGRQCPARGAAFDAAYSAVAYAGVAREVLHALKFAAARPLAGVMAEQITRAVPASLLANVPSAAGGDAGSSQAVIVAVPPHPVRRRIRGFDPADLISRALARRVGLQMAAALRRRGAPSQQLGATRSKRLEGDRLGFQARGAAPRRVVLVDDVHTTGATLHACARTLRDAGAEHVVAVTWARTCDGATSVENDHPQAYHR
jgi:ComF family protein